MNTAVATTKPVEPERFYIAVAAAPSLSDHAIAGWGTCRHEAIENAWHAGRIEEDDRPRVETDTDDDGITWHVVLEGLDSELGRYRDVERAHERCERAGYVTWECTERLHDALCDGAPIPDLTWHGSVADLAV